MKKSSKHPELKPPHVVWPTDQCEISLHLYSGLCLLQKSEKRSCLTMFFDGEEKRLKVERSPPCNVSVPQACGIKIYTLKTFKVYSVNF